MRLATIYSVLSGFCAAIAGSALGCNILLKIDEYTLGPDGAVAVDAAKGSSDGRRLDSGPPDSRLNELRIGYPDDLGNTVLIPGNFLWAISLPPVSRAATLDKFGFISRSTDVSVKLALYADDMNLSEQPGGRVVEVQEVMLEEGNNEIDVEDLPLPPGGYWLAMVFDGNADLGGGPPDTRHYYVYHEYAEPLPLAFPGANRDVAPALNFYLVLKP